MKLSERGYRKIKSYEGYGKQTADGGCVAYQEVINGKRDVPTIGYGCTKSIEPGTVWTREQAEDALKAEIATHEARVTRLVTVELNQNEADALISFDFNTGGLAKSSLLKLLNSGDRVGAAKAFGLWNRFGGKPCKALTARRADEAALFLEPTEPAEPNTMPQVVEAATQPPSRGVIATMATAGTAAASQVDPAAITGKLSAWSELAHTLQAFGPWVLGGFAFVGGLVWIVRGK